MLAEADKARAAGKQVVLIQHHNIVQHYDAQSNMEKMLRDRAATVGVDDKLTESLITFFNTIYSMRIEPGLKSMLQDINQFNNSDKRLESRTDDLSTVLRLGR
jgi:hypothetical protein